MSNFVRQSYKLFVGNLPWTIGQKELQTYFSKFGHVSSSSIIYDKQQGFSKGFGFVTFSSSDAYNSACNQNVHFLEGRVLNVKEANNQ
ncbi:glycine-rich RNA-binding protein 8 [Lucilia cuprina]|uniref:glycine-rich RNA-binding protein 8 n=1 Tax=Lucilia cuprina TaxID=7375 RepID=UPI000C71A671|nr:glycine-rich RNA-binding protein 8 [Lucilia cuprina]XP_037822453.1 glycine-rich RNA-binding protein 8 [Lucilia sericata]